MHVPDGFLDAPTSITTGVVAAAVVGVALRKARGELDDRTAPLAGLVAAFVFATQMLNFPVFAGTSGHLLGGAIAAVLVGPWTGVLCTSVVFLVQCLLFADGGITALGTLTTAMISVHILIGIGEGIITFLAIGSIIAVRPDLVYGARGVLAKRPLEIRTAAPTASITGTGVVA